MRRKGKRRVEDDEERRIWWRIRSYKYVLREKQMLRKIE